MNVGEGLSKTFSIPISHLDYEYIKNCDNVQELEKIYYTLHAGEEGYYPDLLIFCENHLKKLCPNSRILRKPEAIKNTNQLDDEQKQHVTQEIADFIRISEQVNNKIADECGDNERLTTNIPIRGKTMITSTETKSKSNGESKSFKSRVPRNYKEWSKLEAELDKEILEESEEQGRQETSKTTTTCTKDTTTINTINKGINCRINTKGMTDLEKERVALLAKDKGNEAFKSGDFEESISYYSQSLSVISTPTVHNNRGMAYMKLKKWKEAMKDLTITLKSEPENIKALLRRSSCNYELHNLEECIQDCRKLLTIQPDNKTTQNLLTKADEELQKRKVPRLKGGKRMVITEVDSEEEDDDDTDEENHEVDKKDPINIKDQPLIIEEVLDSEEPILTYNEIKQKGNELFKLTKFQESLDYYDKLTKMEPNNPIGYRNRAITNLNLGNFKTAVKDCDTALKFDSTSSLAYFRRGKAYKGLEDYDESMRDFEKALSYTTAAEFVHQIQLEINDVKKLIYEAKMKQSKLEKEETTITEPTISEEKKEEDCWELVDHQQTLLQSSSPLKQDDEIPETIHPAIPAGEMTPYNFEKRLIDIKRMNRRDATLAESTNIWRNVIQLLVDAGVDNILKLMSNKIDGESLMAIISGLEVYSRNKDHRHFVMNILSKLVLVDRFCFVKLMLPDSCIDDYEKIFERLNKFDTDSCLSAQLQELHMKFEA